MANYPLPRHEVSQVQRAARVLREASVEVRTQARAVIEHARALRTKAERIRAQLDKKSPRTS